MHISITPDPVCRDIKPILPTLISIRCSQWGEERAGAGAARSTEGGDPYAALG